MRAVECHVVKEGCRREEHATIREDARGILQEEMRVLDEDVHPARLRDGSGEGKTLHDVLFLKLNFRIPLPPWLHRARLVHPNGALDACVLLYSRKIGKVSGAAILRNTK